MNLYIKKAFDITKNNLIITQPLVLFLIIASFASAALFQQANKIAYIVFFITNFLLTTAFLAGWFYMIKKAIEHSKKNYPSIKEKNEASIALGKEFFPGVGDYFLPITTTTLFYVLTCFLITFISIKLGTKILPNPNINWTDFFAVANSTPVEMQKYVYSLSINQIKALNLWVFFVGGITCAYTFLTMFLFPAVFTKKENIFLAPFNAFNRDVVFVFKNFIGSLGLAFFLFFAHILLSILSLLLSINIIFSILSLIISFYFMTYAIVLIFLYYEEKK